MHRHQAKLHQINNPEPELQKRLLAMSKLFGVKEPPSPEEIQAMSLFLMEEFSDFAYNEISKAFSMAAAGKLQIDAETYNSFNIPYVGKILNAYREHRAREVLTAKRNEEESLPETKQLTPEEHYNWIVDYIEKYDVMPLVANWDQVYRHLKKVAQTPNKEQGEAFYEKTVKQVKQDQKKMLMGQDIALGKKMTRALQDERYMKAYCREQWVKQFLQDKCKK